MGLGVAALSVQVVLQDTAGMIERVVDGGVGILMAGLIALAVGNDERGARDVQLDANAVESTVLVVMVRRFDRDTAVGDAMGERFELAGSFAHILFDGRRGVDAMERDLDGYCHGFLHVGDKQKTCRRRNGDLRSCFH
jgi:hypothetical protein